MRMPGSELRPRETKQRRFLLGSITASAGVLAPLLLAEVVLRFLPVTEPVYAQPVNAGAPYRHFLPDRDVTYSKGWNFSITSRKHINNLGFASDSDFVRDGLRPLITVIGDSFVEAWEVPNPQTMHGLLGARVAGRGRVYGIGVSGSPLSQYLAYAEMARDEFSPDGMVFVIIANDFDESLLKYKRAPGFHYFVMREGALELERIDHPGQSALVKAASRSALVRYMRYTVGFDLARVRDVLGPGAAAPGQFVGNVAADVSAGRVTDSKAAIATFLGQLPARSGLPADRIMFVVDAIRPQLYTPGELALAERSFFGQMRTHFMEQASSAGFEVIDMTPAFISAWARDGRRFEFPNDNHWNPLGHSVVAEQIAASTLFSTAFGPTRR